MTRSHKFTDKNHNLAEGEAQPEAHLPKFFAKSGHADADPNKTKKNGGGKGNWGVAGHEAEDYGYNMANPRRRSNSSSHGHDLKNFKTKFETVEPEPVFEEELHGPLAESDELEHAETISSNASGSVAEEDMAKKA